MMIAVVVVLGGIVAVAVGHGGELSHEEVDHAPLDMGPMSATDVVLLRPPTALWGYSVQITDQALERIAGAIRDRDVRIVALEQRIAELTGNDDYRLASPARHARRNQQLSDAGFSTVTEPYTGTSPAAQEEGAAAAQEPAAAQDQPAATGKPPAGEIAHDQAVNRTDG
jgi:hypothetical protein